MGSVLAPEYRVSRADVASAAELAAFIWAAWTAVDHDSSAFSAVSEAWVRRTTKLAGLRKRLADDTTPILVVRAGKAIVGVAAMTWGEDEAEITELVVHPVAEHSGVGGELLDEAVRYARRMKVRRVLTHADSPSACDFFLHRGFVAASGNQLELAL